jgi:Flp pilus assembly protein TadD
MDIPSLLRLAAEHVHAQHYGEAEGLYRQVLALRPDEPNALYGLGVVAMAARAYDDAARLIGAAVKKQPKAGLWYQTLGDALRQAGRPDEAREAYARGARLLPNEPRLYNNLGAACQETGRLEEALRAFRRAVDLAPDDPLYLTNLAGVLLEAGTLRGKPSLCGEGQPYCARLRPRLDQPWRRAARAGPLRRSGNGKPAGARPAGPARNPRQSRRSPALPGEVRRSPGGAGAFAGDAPHPPQLHHLRQVPE